VVTFLFTDVEGSTRRWEADAQAMRAALAAHDKVLRRAIEAHGGWLFKHTGDGAYPQSAAATKTTVLPARLGLTYLISLSPRIALYASAMASSSAKSRSE
jgi:class 3 adenylate cyclase